ncbi:type II toxin-antitoxin system MqsR family toxin [Stenotrophomonas sp. Marseille-Q4652]|uniref:type II toxin-antitoxin system MqsR family toxin n=1 Tax=Stenotrophomonas sp. Marseille-Q4652 TaxID=2866595 RepID=UPI001CE49F24|nr:type II toxin-antitoxin system MqsR family toxin [Stenotrophomonas sp. Marseille-Q4652]
MEKKSAHYPLAKVKEVVAIHGVGCFTGSARKGVEEMKLTTDEALAAIAALERSDCYKSMTTHADHRIWQDVYHCDTPAGAAYVKFTLIEPPDANTTPRVVISFKRLEENDT